MSREAFEQWISSPPYEHSIKKYPDDASKAAWPNCYRDITVQIAWDAWRERERQFMQTDQMPVVWARPDDIRATMIATIGERAEVAPDKEPGFTVPLYTHPEQKNLIHRQNWTDVLEKAEQYLNKKPVFAKFANGTPLSNDVAVWMADFYMTLAAAQQNP